MSSTVAMVANLIPARAAPRALCATAMAFAALVVTTPAAQAGLLDFLFNPADHSVVEPHPSASVLQQQNAMPAPQTRTAHAPLHHALPAIRKSKDEPCCKSGENPVAYLLHDPTLRPGDAVMTPDGIRIFEGPIASHHARRDFVSLAEARRVEPSKRAELAQIDVREGEVLPARNAPQQQSKSKLAGQMPAKDVRRIVLADR